VRLDITDPIGSKLASSSPYENRAARPGEWKVTARLAGYEDQQRAFNVPPDDDVLEKLELKQLGSLKVAGTPEGARISVKGPGGFQDEGGLPSEWEGLKSGTYEVKVTRTGYNEANETARVEPGRIATIKISLNKTLSSGEEKIDPKTRYEFVALPGGTFLMGCVPAVAQCTPHDRPPRQVTVRPFPLGRTEVTAGQYGRCVNAGRCEPQTSVVYANSGTPVPRKYSEHCNYGKPGRETHPINCVDWKQARNFCEWIGARLPTSEEWEWAAKGGEDRTFAWGNAEPAVELARFDVSGDGTARAGIHLAGASKHGLLDMAGNVREWIADEQVSADLNTKNILVRGGSWSR